jgi:hypothetical protein
VDASAQGGFGKRLEAAVVRAGAVFKDGDDASGPCAIGVFADVLGYGVAGFAEFGGEQRRGAGFLVREFGCAWRSG